jgi:hypothetical protein
MPMTDTAGATEVSQSVAGCSDSSQCPHMQGVRTCKVLTLLLCMQAEPGPGGCSRQVPGHFPDQG